MSSSTGIPALLESMPCTGTDWDVDGSCNEPNRQFALWCQPLTGDGIPVTPMEGTRDSYNAWDMAEMIAGDQADERSLNCVDDAGD